MQDERSSLQKALNRAYVTEISQKLEKLVHILIEQTPLLSSSTEGGYDSEAAQSVLRDFENSHAVQSCGEKVMLRGLSI